VRRLLGTAADTNWTKQWKAKCDGITGTVGSYEESASQLRDITKSRVIQFTDLRDSPERFFKAHRILADRSPELGPGFFIRYTVQNNLFGGTVLAVGGPEHLEQLEEIQDRGQLGCFALTERLAGVNSGLVVNTQVTWQAATGDFLLHTPNEGAEKNWISQGLVGDKAVVVADLLVSGSSYGPHAFLMDLREDGRLVEGVTLSDMGLKTMGNDLDNARIRFDNVRLPHSAMLNRFATVNPATNEYEKKQNAPTMAMIGQRLYSGRVAVAQAALAFRRRLFEMTHDYTDQKPCWSPAGQPALSTIPQLRALYQEADSRLDSMDRFAAQCETALSRYLVQEALPPDEVTTAIAVAKIKCVEDSIDACFQLKQEVGSYALMGGTGFDQMDFLQCCKFAEGDSRILMLKLARDCLRYYQKNGTTEKEDVDFLCQTITERMGKHLAANGGDKQAAFDAEAENVYMLANNIMTSTLGQVEESWRPEYDDKFHFGLSYGKSAM